MYLKAKKTEIANRRKALGYSQSGLSEKAGLGHAAVYRMEEMDHRVHIAATPVGRKHTGKVLRLIPSDHFDHLALSVTLSAQLQSRCCYDCY